MSKATKPASDTTERGLARDPLRVVSIEKNTKGNRHMPIPHALALPGYSAEAKSRQKKVLEFLGDDAAGHKQRREKSSRQMSNPVSNAGGAVSPTAGAPARHRTRTHIDSGIGSVIPLNAEGSDPHHQRKMFAASARTACLSSGRSWPSWSWSRLAQGRSTTSTAQRSAPDRIACLSSGC